MRKYVGIVVAGVSLVLAIEHCNAQWRNADFEGVKTSSLSLALSPEGTSSPKSRAGISAGMGVSYVNPQDVVDYINGAVRPAQRISDFKSAVEFFGALVFPVTSDWNLKLEYTYLLGTYNVPSQFGSAEFTFVVNMPTVIGQYVLVEEGAYNVKVGAGIGYHLGSLLEKYLTLDDKLTGHGVGVLLDLEANTAFGEDFFGYLGANLRWDFIGDLTNSSRTSTANLAGLAPTLQFFSIGARLGFTYYF
jgi:hypothetical protein